MGNTAYKLLAESGFVHDNVPVTTAVLRLEINMLYITLIQQWKKTVITHGS